MVRIIVPIILILVLFSEYKYAQSGNISVSGWVTDSLSGEVLVGTNIILYKDSIIVGTPPLKGTTTNEYGFYAFAKLEAGKYFIITRHIGYAPKIEGILLTGNATSLTLNIGMSEKDVELEEIVVKSERENEQVISTINLSPEILSQLPSLSGEMNVIKSLELLPGVKTSGELSKGLYIRGGSPDQVLTLVDGVMVYNPAHLGNFASTFNSGALQNVKLIKGAFPAEYGGRLSSVLDIKLRSGTRAKEKRTLSLGMISSNFSAEGPLGSNSTFMLSGRKMYYDFLMENFYNDNIIPRYNFYDLNAKLTYNISKNDIVSISGLFGEDNLYDPPKNNDINYDISWKNNTVSVNWLKINSESLLINSTASYIDYRFRSLFNNSTGDAGSFNYFASSKLKDLVFKSGMESNSVDNHIFKSGFELIVHNYNLIYSDAYSEELEEDPEVPEDIFATEAALYLQDTWDIASWLKTNFGGRFYYFKSKEYFRFEPRINFSISPVENININLAYAAAHQFLHLVVRNDISLPTDLWYPSSDRIKPARSSQFVFGINTSLFNEQYLLSVETYYKSMDNLLEFTNSTPLQKDEIIEDKLTAGKGESYGVELFVNRTFGDITGWLGYTLSWTRKQFDELNAGRIFYPKYDRRHDISAVLVYRFSEKLNAGITWTFASGQGFTLPTGQYMFFAGLTKTGSSVQFNYTGLNEYRLETYHKMDLNITYSWKLFELPVRTFINIYNLYNRSNPFAYYITNESNSGETVDGTTPVLKKLTLFPFLPTIGMSFDF